MKKGALDLTIKALFALFIILFVLFVGFSILGTRQSTLEQRADFSQERSEQSFFLSLLGSPCLSVVDHSNRSFFVETQGFLSQKKLDRLHLGNEDLRCAESFSAFYSVKVTDEVNGREWIAGITPSDLYGETRVISMPATILYDLHNNTQPSINIGRAFLTRYDSPLARFYGKIKQVCRQQASDSISLNLERALRYDNVSNIISFGTSSFYPYFGCGVANFTITPGRHLTYLSYREGKVSIS